MTFFLLAENCSSHGLSLFSVVPYFSQHILVERS